MSATLGENANIGVAILDRLLMPADAAITPDTARALLSLRFPEKDERRMNRLAAKARKGALTAPERFEAEQFNLVSHMLALLQAKARAALRHHGQDADSA